MAIPILEIILEIIPETGLGEGGDRTSLLRMLHEIELGLEDFETSLESLSDRCEAALNLVSVLPYCHLFTHSSTNSISKEFNLSGERLNLIMMWFTAFTVLFTPIAFVAVGSRDLTFDYL